MTGLVITFSKEALMQPVVEAFERTCPVCGNWGEYTKEHRSIRETYMCKNCRSNLRFQGQAETLLCYFAEPGTPSLAALAKQDRFRSLKIFEPGLSGPFRRFLRDLSFYRQSFYWKEIPSELSLSAAVQPGRNGVENQDLMDLTFPDESFDLVITSDILAHVRCPYAAFREIRRVLRTGGMHIFSVPLMSPMPHKTVYRVDTSGDEDVLVEPPQYHGAPITGRSLVYTDFGADMLEELDKIGLCTVALELRSPHDYLRRLLSFASTRVQPDGFPLSARTVGLPSAVNHLYEATIRTETSRRNLLKRVPREPLSN